MPTVTLDSYEEYLLEATEDVLNEAREKKPEHLHKIFQQVVEDTKLLSMVNRLLKKDNQPPVNEITMLDLIEAGLALKHRLKCRFCDPYSCDGTIYRLENNNGRVVGGFKICRKFYKFRILIPKIESQLGDKVHRLLHQFNASSLEELTIPQLKSVLSEVG